MSKPKPIVNQLRIQCGSLIELIGGLLGLAIFIVGWKIVLSLL